MLLKSIKLLLLTLACTMLTAPGAFALQAELNSGTISPGDAFVLKVTAASAVPEATLLGRKLSFGPCGEGCYFSVGAVDVGMGPGEYVLRVKAGGEGKSLKIIVKDTKFPVINLNLPKGKVVLSKEDEYRTALEAGMLRALWDIRTGVQWDDEGFKMPLGNSLSTGFGVKRVMNSVKTSVHRGIDIRGASGEPVLAAGRGKVVLTEDLFYGGNTLVIDHGLGIYTVYMHLSRFRAADGDVVAGGHVIAEVGATGRATGPHLHFTVKVTGVSTNPRTFMRLGL